MDPDRILAICQKCGAYCCSYGGTTATAKEREKILKAGHPDHFVKVSENLYVTAWGKNGVCPYLEDNACSIHKVRPLLCKAYPTFFVTQEGGKRFYLLQHCPLTKHLSKTELAACERLLAKSSPEWNTATDIYFRPHAKELERRIGKFPVERKTLPARKRR